MLKKRLVGTVIVRNGWAVQSFGYSRYLPLGRPACIVENLNRWGADEILVQSIDRSRNGLGPDMALIDSLARLGLDTPLIYGGGIRSVDDALQVVQRGADRIVVDAVLQDGRSVVESLSARLGAQAVIANLPMSMTEHGVSLLDYRTGQERPMPVRVAEGFANGLVSEVLLTDWRHEGMPAAFDQELLDAFPCPGLPLIAFGGISEPRQIRSLLARPNVAAVAIGNFLSYQEHAIQKLRNAIDTEVLRPAIYAAEYSLIRDV